MQSLMEIENAIERLPEGERMKLLERLETKIGDAWDRQFEADVHAGRLDSIAQQALREHRDGQSTPFPLDAK